jgi:hypothetical protein
MADIKIKGPQKVLSWGINDGIQDKNQPYFFMYELRWIQRTFGCPHRFTLSAINSDGYLLDDRPKRAYGMKSRPAVRSDQWLQR